MIRDSLRNVVTTATVAGCAFILPTNARAQRYGSGNGTELGQEVAGIQQALRATNARLQQLESEVAALRKGTSAPSGGGHSVSYTGGSSKYTPSGSGFVHRVARGETLSSISRRYAVGLDRIAASNQLVDPHRLKIGQEIFIPGVQGGSAAAPASTNTIASSPATSSGSGSYVVRSGDTLSSIARNHGTSVNALIRDNNLPNPDSLRIGQRLTVPGASGHGSAPSTPPQEPARNSSSGSNATGYSGIYDDPPVANSDEVEAPEGYGWYQVVPGDTLHSIGQDFSVTTKDLMKLNDLTSHELRPGQYLLVPVDDESLYES